MNYLTNQLPEWARPDHPMIRYALSLSATSSRRLVFRFSVGLIVVAMMIILGYFYAVAYIGFTNPPFRAVLYIPLVIGQIVMQLLALTMTVNAIALERQKGTWESLQVTLTGATELVRTRWALVFYRLRWILATILLLRMGFVFLLLKDTTAFEGRAIDVRIIGIAPEVTLEIAIFLLTALVAAVIILPVVLLAMDAAMGIFIGSTIQRRGIGILSIVSVQIARLVVSFIALGLGQQIIKLDGTTQGISTLPGGEAWGRVLLLTTQGDMGLSLLNLETLGNLWADLPGGIYLGLVIFVITILFAVISNFLILWAAKRAREPNKA